MKPDIYKESYDFEWDHRSHLTSALNIPIAGSTVVGGGLAVMVQGFQYKSSIGTVLFISLATIAIIALLSVLYFIFRAFHGYKYSRIATPTAFHIYYNELLEWHNKWGDGKKSADSRFEEYFNQRLAEAAEINAHNNKKRSAYLYRANASLAVCLLFVVFSSAPYLITKASETEKIHHIKIINYPKVNTEENVMPDNEDNSKDEEQESAPPEPAAPRNEEVKEYTVEKEARNSSSD